MDPWGSQWQQPAFQPVPNDGRNQANPGALVRAPPSNQAPQYSVHPPHPQQVLINVPWGNPIHLHLHVQAAGMPSQESPRQRIADQVPPPGQPSTPAGHQLAPSPPGGQPTALGGQLNTPAGHPNPPPTHPDSPRNHPRRDPQQSRNNPQPRHVHAPVIPPSPCVYGGCYVAQPIGIPMCAVHNPFLFRFP
ncbi:hypothetical protein JAAARDRAFT_79587 [Jaapia argillacea MUCL 33604]|uniref:Uncharacterized protein n=1 Tax=Jaapia argillacea MUCL 33604 TaxID=933084 RepID=A0A067PMY0_9AGAM|nr:hypothetical protein JAAARDRAFT_79587 [Jaapia argillacea MUCL 33604]